MGAYNGYICRVCGMDQAHLCSILRALALHYAFDFFSLTHQLPNGLLLASTDTPLMRRRPPLRFLPPARTALPVAGLQLTSLLVSEPEPLAGFWPLCTDALDAAAVIAI